MPILFPFAESWWIYLSVTIFVLSLLALDLGIFHRKAHAVSVKEAAIWCVVWVALAVLFNFLLYQFALWKFTHDPEYLSRANFNGRAEATRLALEFLTGYVIEECLSIDNVFVFVVVFNYFAIPAKYQHRILFYGILGALIFRGLFIAAGSLLMSYHAVVLLFGVFLIITGGKIIFASEKKIEPEKNFVIKLLRRFFPVWPRVEDQKFIRKHEGKYYITPLLVTLVFVEVTDIIFAIDSVPAIYAITREPLIVFTSNIFAILGLRAMYFLLADVMARFHLLKYGLGVILCFVGLKMVWLDNVFEGKFPVTWSLGVIGACLALSTGLSVVIKPRIERQ